MVTEQRILEILIRQRIGLKPGTVAKMLCGAPVKGRKGENHRAMAIRVGRVLSRYEKMGILVQRNRSYELNPERLASFLVGIRNGKSF